MAVLERTGSFKAGTADFDLLPSGSRSDGEESIVFEDRRSSLVRSDISPAALMTWPEVTREKVKTCRTALRQGGPGRGRPSSF